ARRLARAAGLDIAALPGSGRRGRIERADVERALADGSSAMTGSASDASLRAAHGLAYQLNGPEAGKPVVLVHGLAGDHTVWASVATGLARAGRRVLVVDLPAHGNATAEAAAPDELAGGLADLVAETLGDASSVISHSLGAVPAIALAEAGRARNLTLVAPVGLGVHIDRDFVLGLAAASAPGEVSHLLARMTDGPLPLSEDAVAEIATTLAKGRLMKLAGSIVGETGQAVDLRPALARLAETMPVRILAPHRDRIVDWRDALTVSPRIAIHHLPRAGHLAWWDAPRDVLAILMAATEE
ncbi:MAG: alpha/beta fold hydrolase, partial [Pseudomonadota bacterium]